MSSSFSKARTSAVSLAYASGVRISHIVRPARRDAVVSLPATLGCGISICVSDVRY